MLREIKPNHYKALLWILLLFSSGCGEDRSEPVVLKSRVVHKQAVVTIENTSCDVLGRKICTGDQSRLKCEMDNGALLWMSDSNCAPAEMCYHGDCVQCSGQTDTCVNSNAQTVLSVAPIGSAAPAGLSLAEQSESLVSIANAVQGIAPGGTQEPIWVVPYEAFMAALSGRVVKHLDEQGIAQSDKELRKQSLIKMNAYANDLNVLGMHSEISFSSKQFNGYLFLVPIDPVFSRTAAGANGASSTVHIEATRYMFFETGGLSGFTPWLGQSPNFAVRSANRDFGSFTCCDSGAGNLCRSTPGLGPITGRGCTGGPLDCNPPNSFWAQGDLSLEVLPRVGSYHTPSSDSAGYSAIIQPRGDGRPSVPLIVFDKSDYEHFDVNYGGDTFRINGISSQDVMCEFCQHAAGGTTLCNPDGGSNDLDWSDIPADPCQGPLNRDLPEYCRRVSGDGYAGIPADCGGIAAGSFGVGFRGAGGCVGMIGSGQPNITIGDFADSGLSSRWSSNADYCDPFTNNFCLYAADSEVCTDQNAKNDAIQFLIDAAGCREGGTSTNGNNECCGVNCVCTNTGSLSDLCKQCDASGCREFFKQSLFDKRFFENDDCHLVSYVDSDGNNVAGTRCKRSIQKTGQDQNQPQKDTTTTPNPTNVEPCQDCSGVIEQAKSIAKKVAGKVVKFLAGIKPTGTSPKTAATPRTTATHVPVTNPIPSDPGYYPSTNNPGNDAPKPRNPTSIATTPENKPQPEKKSDPIVVSSGNFILHQKDLLFPGAVRGLEFERFYNSKSVVKSELGSNWTHSYSGRVFPMRIRLRGGEGGKK